MQKSAMHKFLAFLLIAQLCLPFSLRAADLPLDRLNLPPGFAIEVWVDNIENARQMARGDQGTLFVGSRGAGKVYMVPKIDSAGEKRVLTLMSGMRSPSGIAFHDGDLYVADVSDLWRFRDIENHLLDPPEPELVLDTLPTDRMHGWKNIDFGPDGGLYIPVGAPCNVCDPGLPYASIHRINLDSMNMQLVATGIRNTVGFDWHPQTGQLWFTENGRDMMGDDLPPCEINVVTQPNQHFGYPYLHASNVPDPEFATRKPADVEVTPPALELGAHVAPLGLHFYQGDMFPEQWQGSVFVAEHGSWNRSEKIGYRLMVGEVQDEKIVNYRPFVDGWLQPGDLTWGRPVAFEPLPDGSLLVSDDYAGVIYRISYDN